MIPLPVLVALALALLGISAHTSLKFTTVAGAMVSIPALWLVLAVIVLALLVMLAILARLLIQDGFRSRPRWAER